MAVSTAASPSGRGMYPTTMVMVGLRLRVAGGCR
jgi:hypothetical protein